MAALQRLALRGTPKATKKAARYTPAGGAERCGMCRHYVPSSSCARIEGPVSAAGWCQLYSQQVTWRPRAGQLAGLNPGLVPPGVTLDLSFMAAGALDPRVTFTRASTATYFDASGTMRTAAINAPRWDYDPVTHALRGLLIEEARTNSVYPTVVGGANWVGTSVAALGGSVTFPDGTSSTAALISPADTSNTVHSFNTSALAVSAGATYTVTAFFKSAPTNAYIQINLTGGTTAVPIGYYDLTAGTAVVGADLLAGATAKSASISPLPNGWWRASFTFTNTGTNTVCNLYIGPCVTVASTGDNRSYAGALGQGVYLWGAQLEAGAFPTSYIPTTAAAVTRAVDVCGMLPANMGWFAPPGGSWMAEFVTFNPLPGSSGTRIVSFPAVSSIGPVFLTAGLPINGLGQYDGAVVNTANTVSVNTIAKGATTWAPGNALACLNGGAVASSAGLTTGYALLASGGVQLGANASAADGMSGYIRRVRYWPRALSAAELQSVTT